MKNYDVTALGELLIDFTPAGKSVQGNALYEQNPGGAPTNVLAAVVRQGGSAALISAVGEDGFGHYLKGVAESVGIDASGLQFTAEAATTLAFVTLSDTGDRSFSFCRKPGADQKIKKELLDLSLLDNCQIYHFGSLSLCADPAKEAALYAAQYARDNGKLVSYDPNWRPPLWDSEEAGIAGMKLGMPYANILKLSGEELELLSGLKDPAQGTEELMKAYPSLKLAVITLGPDGCFYRCGSHSGYLPTYDVKVADTTGSGDAFWGALLRKIAAKPACIDGEMDEYLRDSLDFANGSGSYCATGRGAIPSIPTEEQVEQLRKACPHCK